MSVIIKLKQRMTGKTEHIMLYVSELFESEIAMLISAECYYDLYIKGKEKEVIVGEISTLRNEMARLKQKLESPYYEYEEQTQRSKDYSKGI